jgi:hypothetical protein
VGASLRPLICIKPSFRALRTLPEWAAAKMNLDSFFFAISQACACVALGALLFVIFA